jgi:hypothetical protein
MPRGGKRNGAGRPKGSVEAHTLRKLAVRQRFLKRFEEDAEKLYAAQFAQAMGTKFLVARDRKSGKFIPLDEEKTKLMLACGQADEMEIWDRPPSTQAFVALADRSIDRPTEHQELTGADGGPLLVTWEK